MDRSGFVVKLALCAGALYPVALRALRYRRGVRAGTRPRVPGFERAGRLAGCGAALALAGGVLLAARGAAGAATVRAIAVALLYAGVALVLAAAVQYGASAVAVDASAPAARRTDVPPAA